MDKTLKGIKQSGQAITSISYTAGEGEKKSIKEQDVREFLKSIETWGDTIDVMKLTQEMAEKLGIGCQNVVKALGAFIEQMASNMTLSKETTEEDLKIESLIKQGALSDFDIRELMKLLIKAFSQLINAQREITVNNIRGIMDALQTKIEQMAKSRDENYNAAIAQATAQIVSGCIQVLGSVLAMAGASAGKNASTVKGGSNTENVGALKQFFGRSLFSACDGQAILKLADGLGQIVTGATGGIAAGYQAEAKNADIEATKADALMEVLRKMQEENTNQLKELMDFISTLLRVMQELGQNASATEKSIAQQA